MTAKPLSKNAIVIHNKVRNKAIVVNMISVDSQSHDINLEHVTHKERINDQRYLPPRKSNFV